MAGLNESSVSTPYAANSGNGENRTMGKRLDETLRSGKEEMVGIRGVCGPFWAGARHAGTREIFMRLASLAVFRGAPESFSCWEGHGGGLIGCRMGAELEVWRSRKGQQPCESVKLQFPCTHQLQSM